MSRRLLAAFALAFPIIAHAAPAFERPITLPTLSERTPVFIVVPEGVLRRYPLSDLRVLREGVVVDQKFAEPGNADLGGSIADAILCSNDVGSVPQAVHDGNPATTAKPDVLKNPNTCTLTLKLRSPMSLSRIALALDQPLKKLAVSAKNGGEYVKLREVENASAIDFSTVTTDGLKIAMTYDVVPSIGEISLQGSLPARVLFLAEPGKNYVLGYGDAQLSDLPSTTIAAVSTTPFGGVGDERMTSADSDKDGLIEAKDNCPLTANANQADQDHDGLGDACDNAVSVPNILQHDADSDGVGNALDNCMLYFNPDQKDSDLNGRGDVCDDQDRDTIVNSVDNCPTVSNADQADADGNGAGDACQLDRDGDGVPDATDTCRSTQNPDQTDGDKDNIGDACDSCPAVANADQADKNSNGLGDACEDGVLDPDNDTVPNSKDNCPGIPNTDQADTDRDGHGNVCDNCPTIQNKDQRDDNGDGLGNACTDADGDALLPPLDNCPLVSNIDQEDKNNNGVGDSCEDDDSDGVQNIKDNCRFALNSDQADKDADGMGDACDVSNDQLSEQHPWVMWIGLSAIVLVLLWFAVRLIVRIGKESRK